MTSRIVVGVTLVGGVLVAVRAAPLCGQSVEVGARVDAVRLLPETDALGIGVFTGVAGGGEARVGFGPAGLEISYVQGTLTDDSTGTSRDVVEGEVFLGASPRPWLRFAGGPHVRSYVTPAGRLRWVFWEVHARAATDLLPAVLATHLEGWWTAGGSVTGGEKLGGGGVEGGLTLRLPSAPLWLRGTYRIERATVGAGASAESLERLTVAAGAAF